VIRKNPCPTLVHLAVGRGDLRVLFEEGYEFQQFLLFPPVITTASPGFKIARFSNFFNFGVTNVSPMGRGRNRWASFVEQPQSCSIRG